MNTSRTLILVGALALLGLPATWAAPTGAAAALAARTLDLEDMLRYAIEDERLARAEYAAILERLGEVAPFTNIHRAELTHIGWLEALYRELGLTLPADTTPGITAPATVAAALEAGRQAEIDNIAMYDRFLEQDLPAGARTVFERLKAASQNHLRAFTQGRGRRG